MGKTVVIATNRLEDISQLCSSVDLQNNTFIGILDSGRFAVFKTFRELCEAGAKTDTAQTFSLQWFNEFFLEATKT